MPARPWFRCFTGKNPTREQVSGEAVDAIDRVLLQLGPRDTLTFREAGHISVMGASGSGKTSTLGSLILLAHLTAGHGGLILSAKDERPRVEAACAYAGRRDDLVIVDETAAESVNFMGHIARTARSGSALAASEVLAAVGEALSSNRQGAATDPFWIEGPNRASRAALTLCQYADEAPSPERIARILGSAPQDRDERAEPDWQDSSYCAALIERAIENCSGDLPPDLRQAVEYLLTDLPMLGDKTRSSLLETLATRIDYLCREPLHGMFSCGTTVTPDDTFQGKVILLDFQTLKNGQRAKIAAVIWKILFQIAVQARDPAVGLPVFLMADEAQEHVLQRDAAFLAVAREYRCSVIYLSQTRSNYDSVLGRGAADALLGNFQTHAFLSNVGVTNEWAAGLLAKTWQNHVSISQGGNEKAGSATGVQSTFNASLSKSFDDQIPPHSFTQLRSASPQNGGIADAVVFTSGKSWASGKNYIRTTFPRVSL